MASNTRSHVQIWIPPQIFNKLKTFTFLGMSTRISIGTRRGCFVEKTGDEKCHHDIVSLTDLK
jgi:hypothetical protein